jgi:cobalamin-dependent methionine synthase I
MDKKEALRYLRTYSGIKDEGVLALADRACEDIEKAARPKTLYRIFDCRVTDDSVIVGETEFKSKRLASHLSGCKRVIAFGATLGAEVDRMIRLCQSTDTALAMAYQAAGATLIEEICDELEEEIKKQQGLKLRPRFSPGYYDLSLDTQKQFFELLELTKRCGITLTDKMLMIPSKSVTAFIGIED